LGAFGIALRLNWLWRKKRSRKIRRLALIAPIGYFSRHAHQARKASLEGG